MIARLRTAFHLQLLPLAIGFVLLAAIIGSRSWLIETQQEENDAVRTAFELDNRLVTALSLAQDAETGQRGYLLTGEDPYLQPYRSAAAALPAEMDAIDAITAPDSERQAQFEALRSAIKEKFAEIDETIALYRSGNAAGALAIVRTDRGKAAMDRIRTVIGEMRREESADLQQRLAASERVDEWLRWGSIAALLGVFAMGAYGLMDARRRLREVIAAHVSLTASNEALRDEIKTRQAAEQQIRQMQKMEAVGQLTGGIAHDFNNMLAVIMSAMNLIQRKLSRGETDIDKFVDAATDATTRAANLTARLLAFARQQPLAPEVIDANRVVTGMSDLLRRSLGETVAIETVLAGGLWRTFADPSQLENAILNLAVNGRDAMPDGGSLTIETANSHLDDGYAAAHAEVTAGQYVMIAVTDTGDRHVARDRRESLRAVLHDQAGEQRHRAWPQPGRRLRQAVGRTREDLFRARRRHHNQGVPAAAFRRGSGSAGGLACRPIRKSGRRKPCWWSRTMRGCAQAASMRCGISATRSSMPATPRRRCASSRSIRMSRCCSPTSSCR